MASKKRQAPEAILKYDPEPERVSSTIAAGVQITMPLIAMALGAALQPDWALPMGVAVWAAMWLWRRRKKNRAYKTLTVVNDSLKVANGDGRLVFDVKLAAIGNVTLETKTIQRVEESMHGGVPEARFINSTVGAEIDTARIEIATLAETHLMTEHFTSKIDALDWLSKIRRFLRAHGWRPTSEREEADE